MNNTNSEEKKGKRKMRKEKKLQPKTDEAVKERRQVGKEKKKEIFTTERK